MSRFTQAAAVALAAAVSVLSVPAWAACSTATTGARCIRVTPSVTSSVPTPETAMTSSSAATPLVDVGQVVPRGEYSIILNADYYGLPPVSDGWVYMRVGQDAFRVDWRTHQVLERVTDRASANF